MSSYTTMLGALAALGFLLAAGGPAQARGSGPPPAPSLEAEGGPLLAVDFKKRRFGGFHAKRLPGHRAHRFGSLHGKRHFRGPARTFRSGTLHGKRHFRGPARTFRFGRLHDRHDFRGPARTFRFGRLHDRHDFRGHLAKRFIFKRPHRHGRLHPGRVHRFGRPAPFAHAFGFRIIRPPKHGRHE